MQVCTHVDARTHALSYYMHIVCAEYARTHTLALSLSRIFADMPGLNIQRFDKRVGTITKTGEHSEKSFRKWLCAVNVLGH